MEWYDNNPKVVKGSPDMVPSSCLRFSGTVGRAVASWVQFPGCELNPKCVTLIVSLRLVGERGVPSAFEL